MQIRNLEMARLAATPYAFKIKRESDGSPYNLTGATLLFAAKHNASDPDNQAAFLLKSTDVPNPFNVTSPTLGEFTLTVPKTATAALPDNPDGSPVQLFWTLKIVPPGGTNPFVPGRGVLSVFPAGVISES